MPWYYSEKRNRSGMESVGNTFMIALGGVFESHSQSQELRNPQQVKNQIYHSQQNRRLKMNI